MSFENYIDKIAQVAAKNNAAVNGDYEKDGILYCGNCNTPKQCEVEAFGKKRIVYCLCKCKSEQREAEKIQQLKQERMLKIQNLRRMGFPDEDMQKWTFSKDDGKNEKLLIMAKKYVDNFDDLKAKGKGLLLFGPVGTGKTFISACIANALIDKGKPCLVTNFARLVNEIQGKFDGKQNYIDNLNNFDLLVIDDLESERNTEYMNEIVQNIIDSRYRAGLPLIITTNLTSKELKHSTEIRKQRIYSRLFEMCYPFEVTGEDRRKQKLIDEFGEIGELLGIKPVREKKGN